MPGVWRRWLILDLRLSGGAINSFRMAMLHAFAGDTERALDWLERAHAERHPAIVFVQAWEALLPELRSHPRFTRILAEMKFPAR